MTLSKTAPLKIGTGKNRAQIPFELEIHRCKRKTLGIYISHGKVLVRCPTVASKAEVTEFIESNQSWIEDRLSEEAIRDREILRIEDGKTIFYRARELTIVFKHSRHQRILVSGSNFIIQGHKLTPEKAEKQLQEFLIKKAEAYIFPRAMGLAEHLGVDKKISKIKLRKTKTKWGHCTSTGVVQYNWMIMLAPYSIIDYMITHEICHLVHMDHSRRFWNLVESFCPNHKTYVEWLKEHEHRFWF
ncbi:MAG: M48 family metallopeptidase [Pseudohongiellaceae bacterium]